MSSDTSHKRISFGPKLVKVPLKEATKTRTNGEPKKVHKAFYISLRDLKKERRLKSRSQSKNGTNHSSAFNASTCFEKVKAMEERWAHVKGSLNARAHSAAPSSPRAGQGATFGDKNRSSSNGRSANRKQAFARLSYQEKDLANIEDSTESIKTKPVAKRFTASKKPSLLFGGTANTSLSITMRTPPRSPQGRASFSRTGEKSVQKLIGIAQKLKQDLEKDSPIVEVVTKHKIGPRPIAKKLAPDRRIYSPQKAEKRAPLLNQNKPAKMRIGSLSGNTDVLMQTCKVTKQKIETSKPKVDFSKTHHVKGISNLIPFSVAKPVVVRNVKSPVKKRTSNICYTQISQVNRKKTQIHSPQRINTETRCSNRLGKKESKTKGPVLIKATI